MNEALSENRNIRISCLAALILRLVCFSVIIFFYGTGSLYDENHNMPLSYGDGQHYAIIAQNLAAQGTYSRFIDPPYEPDSLRTPLLPLYLTPFIYAGGLAAIWVAMLTLQGLLALTAVYTYKLARFFLSPQYSLLAALMVAAEPLLVYRSVIAEPDALFVFLFTVSVYHLVCYVYTHEQKSICWSAGLLSLSILAKPVGLYLIIIFAGVIFLNSTRRLKQVSLFLLTAAICLFPWLLRNKIVFDSWGISSISTYNFYSYYTASLALPGEPTPESLGTGREPERNLAFAAAFNALVAKRIQTHPIAYAQLHLTGTIRNLLASDFPTFYFDGNTRLLPFSYGDPGNHAVLTSLPDVLFRLILILLYLCGFVGLYDAWKKDRTTALFFGLFLLLTLYFVFTPGTFVDAKYRLAALPLIMIQALYGIQAKGYKLTSLMR